MTIVVTGAAGFVGSALVAALLDRGEHVVAVDLATSGLEAHQSLRRVTGNFSDPAVRAAALAEGCDKLVHLATVPGGAAETDPGLSRRVNVDAMYDLLEAIAAAGDRPRVVYASSIAVFGDPLPAEGVDDATPLAPRMIYGGHKAMMEHVVAMMSHRGEIDGVTVRLPGILARPKGPSGMKSAFMSNVFHALREGAPFQCPVSPDAMIWAESVTQCVANIENALTVDAEHALPKTRAVTLPALRVAMRDLVAEISRQCGHPVSLVSYHPDPALEQAFGAHPPLSTPAAERAGFRSDGDVATLVSRALACLGGG